MLNLDKDNIFHIDHCIKNPIKKYDEKLGDYIEDWEVPIIFDSDRFSDEMNTRIDFSYKNSKKNVDVIIVEGILLYYRNDISDLIEMKILL